MKTRSVRARSQSERRHSLHRKARVALEGLEGRVLLSTSIPLSNSTWTLIGPAPIAAAGNPTGRVAGIAADPITSNKILLATTGGGVWGINVNSPNWTPLTDSQPTLFTGAIAIAPSNRSIIYAGTGEANNSADSYAGRGLLKSTDGGSTWSLIGASVFDRVSISRIVVDPTNANTVYAATADGINSLSTTRGIWKSTDGGTSWTNTTAAISTTISFSDLAIHPTNQQILYAAAGSAAGSTSNGIYKSTNGGASWSLAGDFPTGDINNGRISIAIARSSPQVVYASVMNAATGALYRMLKSIDSGAHWFQLASVPNFAGTQGVYDTALVVDPANANILYAAGASGTNSIIRSSNGGNTWTDISTGASGSPHGGHHALTFDAAGKLLDGNDGGIWRLDNSTPGSIQWTSLNTAGLAITPLNSIATDPTTANIAYAGTQGTGTVKFSDSLLWSNIRDADTGFVRVDPTNGSTVYRTSTRLGSAGTAGTGFLERSDNAGATWTAKTTGIASTDPANLYVPYIIAPNNASRLLLGTNRVYESTNRGDSWTALSAPFANGWNSAAPIDAIAASKTNSNTLYASAAGRIFVTTSHGAAWIERDVPGYGDHFSDLFVDAASSLIVYAVRDRVSGSAAGHVFQSTDGGVNWSDLSDDTTPSGAVTALPDLATVSFDIDPRNPGIADDILYAGTEAGIYAFDSANPTGWLKLATGMPNAQVVDLEVNPTTRVLTAATHGRGAWQLLLNVPGAISGKVFQDFNASGTFDPGEIAMSGTTVYLDANNNGSREAGETFVTTSAAGDYTFSSLANATYRVRQVLPTGYVSPVPATGAYTINIINGTVFTNQNFTNFPLNYSGSAASDTFVLRVNPSNLAQVQVIANVNGVVITRSVPTLTLLAFNSAFQFDGASGNDTFTIDTSSGVPYTTGGVTIIGGADSNAPGDSLIFAGSTASESFDVAASAVTTTAVISYAQIETLTINASGGDDTIVYNGPLNVAFSFNVGTGFDTFLLLSGTYVFNSDVISQSPNLQIRVVSGQVIFNSTQHLGRLVLLFGGTAIMSANGDRYLQTRELVVASDTRLDLNDNDLLVDYDGAAASPFTDVDHWITTGYSADPNTTVHGIISTTSQQTGGNTILATFDNQFYGLTEWPPGSGNTIDPSTIVGKYTYIGDTNFDGQVSPQDYTAIDSNFGELIAPGHGWLLGDANLDGIVSRQDYSVIDASLGLGKSHPL
jgi:hypothetical protein